ncbi:MAG: hypothetical protein ACREH6_10645 [Geminicoccaceae bacterium]
MPTTLTVRGSYRGYSGCDRTVRSFVQYLVAAGVQVELIDFPEWGPTRLPDDRREPWFDALAAPVESSTVLHLCMPHQVAIAPGRLNVNFTMFEAPPAPAAWIDRNLQHDLVILPTAEPSRRAWLAAGFPEDRIRLCPLGVDAQRFRPGLAPLELRDRQGRSVADYRVRVLNVSELTARKNLLGLLRTWVRATRADDDAILIIKLKAFAPVVLLRLLRDLHFLGRMIGKSREQAAPIMFLDHVLSDAEMPRLYASATHYWSMSYGEGWDQPMTEAGAAGLQLIAPDHTAYRTYLDPTVASMIPSQPVPAICSEDPWLGPLFEGTTWWQPSEDAAVELVAKAVAGGNAPGLNARQRLATAFSWQQATARLIEILDQLEADCGR